MSDYHTVYQTPDGESTEWDDIQRKLGNLPAKPKKQKPPPFSPAEEEAKGAEGVDLKDEAELSDLEDDEEFMDDRFMAEYRKKRMEELRRLSARPRFGSVKEIRSGEFVAEVTNAGSDIWAVVLLFKHGHEACDALSSCLTRLAAQYTETKFMKIVSTDCIHDYPDHNLPTVLIYNNGACKHTLVGMSQLGGQRASPESVAQILSRYGALSTGGGPNRQGSASRHADDDSQDEDDGYSD
ncbi:unnamed protein product [Ostreobium quekettii]|uniref:Phosducin domain-containing protein n=1 Tax=Ostreobium quekettii TaxID=121088 RepID=A0A8S1IUC0_9CHLO|nr:unnamed protein product [Ostreobium quekettii]|eukprot:evm.model.scf_191.8 EVM.evm.TU.scf_191.8   scf_191:58655-59629(+)